LPHESLEAGVVAEEVRVGVHDELTGEAHGALRRHLPIRGLGEARVEEGAVHLVHGHEGGGHAAGGLKELAPAHPAPARLRIAQLHEARLHATLLVALRRGKVLVARHHLGGNGSGEGGDLGGLETGQLVVAQESHRAPPCRPRV
jgi:hypothetical protein